MPLDTGAVVEGPVTAGKAAADRAPPPNLDSPGDLGQILRAVREYRGLDIEDLAQVTRVRVRYLAAIERMRMDQLPSRPFALGYVRAYAAALGLDGDLAAARFKVEAPDGAEPLRAPVGVRRESDPRLRTLVLAAAGVAAAILTWNVVERVVDHKGAPRRPAASVVVQASAAKPQPAASGQPLALGAPLPAPPESTTPQPYVTPGLEQALPASAAAAAAAAAAAHPAPPIGSPFVAKGVVYGAPAGQPAVIVQARQAAGLVVHGADGSVYFARQLVAGEAYRAPLIGGLKLDVSEPDKFDVYVGGVRVGSLSGPSAQVTDLARMQSPAHAPAG